MTSKWSSIYKPFLKFSQKDCLVARQSGTVLLVSYKDQHRVALEVPHLGRPCGHVVKKPNRTPSSVLSRSPGHAVISEMTGPTSSVSLTTGTSLSIHYSIHFPRVMVLFTKKSGFRNR